MIACLSSSVSPGERQGQQCRTTAGNQASTKSSARRPGTSFMIRFAAARLRRIGHRMRRSTMSTCCTGHGIAITVTTRPDSDPGQFVASTTRAISAKPCRHRSPPDDRAAPRARCRGRQTAGCAAAMPALNMRSSKSAGEDWGLVCGRPRLTAICRAPATSRRRLPTPALAIRPSCSGLTPEAADCADHLAVDDDRHAALEHAVERNGQEGYAAGVDHFFGKSATWAPSAGRLCLVGGV